MTDPFAPRNPSATPAPSTRGLKITWASQHRERETDWLWEPRIPFGHITVIEGDPDLGKSTVTLDLAARVSAGASFPGGTDKRPAARVLIVSAEDSIEETINPRLRAAGARMDHIAFHELDRDPKTGHVVPLTFPNDLTKLQHSVVDHGIRLVIIDPITAYLDEKINTHNDASVRNAMTPLKQVAGDTRAAFLLVRHLNKSGDTKALYRGGGSIAFTGAARSTLLIAQHPENTGERVLCRVKGNLSAPYPAWRYTFEVVDGGRPKIDWVGEMITSADELLGSGKDARTASPARDEAAAFLIDALATGPLAASEVFRLAKAAGVSRSSARRAADELGVVKHKHYREDGRIEKWTWALARESWETLMARAVSPGKASWT
jgi:hypothetical protein